MYLHKTRGSTGTTIRARSARLFSRAQHIFPGGVTRTTVEKDPVPIYVAAGEGCRVVDVDGNRLLDLNNNFTTLIHGHAFAPVAEAVAKALRTGTCFANPTEHEIALAELLIGRIPAMEQVRFVNSGTEAVMFALKAARAFTGRTRIARFEGAYHGAYDWAEAGQNGTIRAENSGRRLARPGYRGAPLSVARNVLVLDFNDIGSLERDLVPHASEVAAILIDPMPSRAGLLRPMPDFIDALTNIAHEHGILLVADEVLNLRQGYHGASPLYGLAPDIITAGKIIGGGFPIGAVGGSAEIMAVFDDDGAPPRVPQGGTFSANPVSMIAGKIAMEMMTPEMFAELDRLGERLRNRLTRAVQKRDAPFSICGAASLFRIHPKWTTPQRYCSTRMDAKETECMRAMSRSFLKEGILLPFGAAACLSTPMTEADVDEIADVFDAFLEGYSRQGGEDIK
ncbi:glutamate-1-semialdehyde 2,1-aminomutase [Paramesorhizobium deserti]|uniref:Glutamate-1-semialdehyde 2,1-aminomutase n=1 Tax=Paramesorhizobium deserti TaxID=1494590 RepID=A0A135I1V9_9HYPH|nr:aspartate aminotransferase family protein [Paramesorhizobium deserti]KXF79429.1 glutamate-1-semialdehyde 2,1-aminomutase [Paramesorhizobium deserti]